jgi:hypothetical protein
MANEIGFAKEYSKLLTAALERGDRDRSLHYVDKIQSLLLRGEVIELHLNLEKHNAQVEAVATA